MSVLDAELSVVKADQVVPEDLVMALQKCVAVLEDVPEREKDWHPGSNGQVLDLLHPSLFPVIFGRTRALKTGAVPLDGCIAYMGQGELTDGSPVASSAYDMYQWLPSEVTLNDTGASITSYVNNLHPDSHRDLYQVLGRFVAVAVPLWEECLSWWEDRRRFKLGATDDDTDFYLPEGMTYQAPREGNGDTDSIGSADSEDYLYSDEYTAWLHEHRILRFPEPNPFVPFDKQVDLAKRVNLRTDFPSGLQVIFKLANIHLTPENPQYRGGTWHIEGTAAERICATALFYYSEDNITPSRLFFRQSIDEDELIMLPGQDAFDSLESYYGVKNDSVAVQELGSVLTRPGRLLTFPNVLQHRVAPFQLEDTTRPGHRKILAMFLVDPHRRVLSTANIPPQQKDWWAERVREVPAFSRLPLELFRQINGMVDTFPVSWDEAIEIRADLMAKRSAMTQKQEEEVNDVSPTELRMRHPPLQALSSGPQCADYPL